MEEVVVTGYGTFKKSAYAGSASTVKTGELKDLPVVSFSSLLEGNAPEYKSLPVQVSLVPPLLSVFVVWVLSMQAILHYT